MRADQYFKELSNKERRRLYSQFVISVITARAAGNAAVAELYERKLEQLEQIFAMPAELAASVRADTEARFRHLTEFFAARAV